MGESATGDDDPVILSGGSRYGKTKHKVKIDNDIFVFF